MMLSHRLSMNEVTTYRWSFEEDVWHYVEAGYGAIGVWRQKIADFGEERGVDLLMESGLGVTNLHWAGGFTGSEGRSLEDSVEDAAQAIQLAAAVNAGCLVVYPGGRNCHTYRHAERLLCLALEQLLDLAEAADVTLAIEPMNPPYASPWTFITSIEDTVSLLHKFGTPHLKLVLDVYYFGDQLTQNGYLRELIPHIALVQLSDRRGSHGSEQNRTLLGEGMIPLPAIVGQLVEHGYDGDYDVELMGQDVQLLDYEYLLECSKNYFDQILTPVARG